MVLSVVVLPAPFDPMQGDDLALPHLEIDALERVDLAVVGVDVLESELDIVAAASADAVRAVVSVASVMPRVRPGTPR